MARVFLHIGGPKTGTTFLQSVLWRDPDLCAEQGLLLPLSERRDHHRASLDLTGLANWMRVPGPVAGTWETLVGEVADHPGDALVSSEFLVHATAEHATRAVEAFTGLGREVHVVITVRDLARFLPSQWQETVKAGRAWTFAEFLEQTREGVTPAGSAQRRLWDYAALVETWSPGVPPERIHVVTAPRSPAPPSLLWERFASVLGLQAAAFSTDVPRTNDSLGAEQAEVLRRVNGALRESASRSKANQWTVKQIAALARRALRASPGATIAIPSAEWQWVSEESAKLVAALDGAGVQVVGDLEDLAVADEVTTLRDAEGPTDAQIAEEAVAALAEVLLANAATRQKQQAKITRLRRRLAAQRPPAAGPVRRTARRVRGGLRRVPRLGRG